MADVCEPAADGVPSRRTGVGELATGWGLVAGPDPVAGVFTNPLLVFNGVPDRTGRRAPPRPIRAGFELRGVAGPLEAGAALADAEAPPEVTTTLTACFAVPTTAGSKPIDRVWRGSMAPSCTTGPGFPST